MQLLCLGDFAPSSKNMNLSAWRLPDGLLLDHNTRVLFNWELPIGDIVNPVPRQLDGPRLVLHPDSANLIQKWAPGFVSLATNHILDAGNKGLDKTIESLNHLGFRTMGAGRNKEEITNPLFWNTDEGRLVMINWVFPETHPDWMSVPGPNCWPGIEAANNLIQSLKCQSDWILVVVHWSDENFSYPLPEDRIIARELAQAGANLVIGHHPHVVRGMELIDSCPVFYSIGNFYLSNLIDTTGRWDLRQAPRNREGIGILVTFLPAGKLEYRILSFWQGRWRVDLDPFHRASRRLERVSKPLIEIQASNYVAWHKNKLERFYQWESKWHFGFRRTGFGGLTRYIFRKIQSNPYGRIFSRKSK